MFFPKLPKLTRGNFSQNAVAGFGFATGIYVASFIFIPLLELLMDTMEQRRSERTIKTLEDLPAFCGNVDVVNVVNDDGDDAQVMEIDLTKDGVNGDVLGDEGDVRDVGDSGEESE